MLLLASLITALIAPFVLPAPSPQSSGPPPGYQSVKQTCSTPEVLYCCNGTGVGGVAGEPTDTQTGCEPAMIGNPPSPVAESGYCPETGGYLGFCCAVSVAAGIEAGCGIPTEG
ncbi:hypothetical protein BDR22DRAFT_885807 [Usnea florida]